MNHPAGIALELHVPDFGPVRQFYTQLGFELLWERAPEAKKGYLVVELEGNVVGFWCGNDRVFDQSYFRRFARTTPRGYGVEVVLTVSDIDGLYETARHHPGLVRELCTQPWGKRDFRMVDPFGYYLRFTEPMDIRDPRYAVP
ncbi:VOC family protein [Nocardia sp. NPDC019395]|uniref:VOC family protein n=1 Tax=Nocardia sp. NPDC019395 TaxID=3154686 RepID=UPI0033BFC6E5